MTTDTEASNLDLGYILYPHRRPYEPGYPRLDVVLRSIPTGQHFDPLKVHLYISSPKLGLNPLTVEHPWSDLNDYTVCAGTMEIIDKTGKHLDAFTFGGSLHIQTTEEYTLLTLTSPAPILVPAGSRLEQFLVDEVKITLAERRAEREVQPGLFEKLLIAAPPFELYYAVITSILERCHHLHSSDHSLIYKLEYALRAEIEAIERQLSIMERRPIDRLL